MIEQSEHNDLIESIAGFVERSPDSPPHVLAAHIRSFKQSPAVVIGCMFMPQECEPLLPDGRNRQGYSCRHPS